MLIFDKKMIQAPLAGYSCAPFRVLAHRFGAPDFCCTEMLSSIQLCSGASTEKRYRYKSPQEGRLCAQLAGDNPEVLATAAKRVVGWGADMVDLNCGCPQPKIRKKNFGSRLLENSTHLFDVVKAVKQAVNVPVLVKIRVDANSGDHYNQDVARAIEKAGADAMTVHGRHWSQDYDIGVSYHDIAMIKDIVNIPVIGNGDIFLEHVRGLIDLEGEHTAILQSRKLGKYYARSYITDQRYFDEILTIKNYVDLERIVKQYFD